MDRTFDTTLNLKRENGWKKKSDVKKKVREALVWCTKQKANTTSRVYRATAGHISDYPAGDGISNGALLATHARRARQNALQSRIVNHREHTMGPQSFRFSYLLYYGSVLLFTVLSQVVIMSCLECCGRRSFKLWVCLCKDSQQ